MRYTKLETMLEYTFWISGEFRPCRRLCGVASNSVMRKTRNHSKFPIPGRRIPFVPNGLHSLARPRKASRTDESCVEESAVTGSFMILDTFLSR